MPSSRASSDKLTSAFSQLRMTTKIKNEADDILRERGITKGRPVMLPKPEPEKSAVTVPVKTNMFSVRINKEVKVFRYDLTVQGEFGKSPDRRTIDFTRRSSSDSLATDRKQCCRIAFDLLIQSHPNFPRKELCVYDLQAILFTMEQIPIYGHNTFEITIPPNHLDTFKPCDLLRYVVKPVEQFNLVLSPKTAMPSLNLEQQNYDLQQFLELLTSQHAMSDGAEHVTFEGGRSYLLNPDQFGFNADDYPQLGRGTYLAIGCQKSCKIVEGPSRGDPRPVLVLESKKTPFHEVQTVLDKVLSAFPNFERDIATHRGVKQLLFSKFCGRVVVCSELFVQPIHIPNQPSFQIMDICENANATKFDYQGKETSINEYFYEKYNLRLRHPEAPLIVGRSKDQRNCFYPMEVLEVCDNQRLTSVQLTPEQTVEIIKSSAVPPSQLDRQIKANCASLRLNNAITMREAGIEINEDAIKVNRLTWWPYITFKINAKMLPGPDVIYAGNIKVKIDPAKGNWGGKAGSARYVLPASADVWACYFCTFVPYKEKEQKTFIDAFIAQCKRKGMIVNFPTEVKVLEPPKENSEDSALRQRFVRAKGKAKFILIVSDAKDFYIHKHLKQLEQEFDIVTQNVKHTTARNAADPAKSRMTMENVVHKTNVKLGGLNYNVYLNDSKELGKKDLFLGFGMNHPGGFGSVEERRRGPPSVVGYAANDLKHPCAFSGDYLFQESRRDEKISIVDDVLNVVIKRYKMNRCDMPERLFLFRNGCSEGQFPLVLRYEVPIIKDTLRKLGCDTKLTLIVPNKQHNLRFYPTNPDPRAKPWDQNLQPGTAIDKVVVHASYFEFFLLSHQARQGTSKVPRYTVIYDENGMTETSMENITYALAFGHQIVACPVGLPAPCYIADSFAERGRAVYTTHSQSRYLANVDNMDLQEMAQKLSYMEKRLRGQRFNA